MSTVALPNPTPLDHQSPEPIGKQRKWMAYGDSIRIFGTLAVIIGHLCDVILYSERQLSLSPFNWWIANFIDAFTRFAVPAYVMLSGALLLDPHRPDSAKDFYRKRLARIGAPLVFWTLFFMCFDVYYLRTYNWNPSKSLLDWGSWKPVLIHLSAGEPFMHLHFIFRIAVLYAFTPMIRVFLKNATRNMVFATIVLLLLLATGDSIRNGIIGSTSSVFYRFVPFLGYYIAGYYFREAYVSKKTLAWCWVITILTMLGVALWSGIAVRTFGASPKDFFPSITYLMYDFLSPLRVIMAISSWIILINMFREPFPKNVHLRKKWAWLSSATLGIYLLHPAVFNFLDLHYGFFITGDIFHHSILIGLPIVTIVVYLITTAIVAVLMKIPVVEKITG